MHQPITRDHKAINIWLKFCLFLVALMVLIGGYTRLSGSGLSITQWKPIHGVIPPLNEDEWQEEFAAYQKIPQYSLINKDMTLDGFRKIFWPEFFHRLLGRFIGFAFAIPLFVFMMRESLSRKFFWYMVGVLLLGGMQGAVGWIMVKSGLTDATHVNHIKLALHLSIALIIFALILWALLDINNNKKLDASLRWHDKPKQLRSYKIWLSLLCVQIIFGAFVAGLHAGLVYNTWPDMNGKFIPDELMQSSALSSPLENVTLVQFIHRTLAIIVSISFLFWWYFHRKYITIHALHRLCVAVAFSISVQFALGILTLIYQVPLALALAHQMMALILWTFAICLLYKVTNCNNTKEYIKLVK